MEVINNLVDNTIAVVQGLGEAQVTGASCGAVAADLSIRGDRK